MRRAPGDRIENGLDVGWRARDHTEDVGSCGLLLQRLFRLVEQPHVLDGDDGLVGEGLEEGDLVVREPATLPASHRDSPDRNVVLKQRYDQHALIARCTSDSTPDF